MILPSVVVWARRLVIAATSVFWLGLCWTSFQTLLEGAKDSPEIYTRTPQFQGINFVVQYLPFYLLVFGCVLAFEWALFAGFG